MDIGQTICYGGIVVGAIFLAIVLWSCLVVSGGIADAEENRDGIRRS